MVIILSQTNTLKLKPVQLETSEHYVPTVGGGNLAPPCIPYTPRITALWSSEIMRIPPSNLSSALDVLWLLPSEVARLDSPHKERYQGPYRDYSGLLLSNLD